MSAEIATAVRIDGLEIVGTQSQAVIVDEISITLKAGEIVGLVGESGSGKSTLGLALLDYYKPGCENRSGLVTIDGQKVTGMSARDAQRVRGKVVAYIPQSPASALNPALKIGKQLRECLPGAREAALERVREVLGEVALPNDDEFLRRYPHQLSGGQQQRVVIAMAFLTRPALIVLDEPTTGLDVTTQKQVLATVRALCDEYQCASLYITHDLAVVAELADRIAVMYSGRIVEMGPTQEVMSKPQHPYTERLMLAIPDLAGKRKMLGILGDAPSPMNRPPGCAFAPRCLLATDECRSEAPRETEVHSNHTVRCFRAGEQQPLPDVWSQAPVQPVISRKPLIEARDLHARYGKKEILKGVDLAVEPGECVAILGESGSGKSTLCRSIVGLHTQFEGNVIFDGMELASNCTRRTKQQRAEIQYIFQDPYGSLNPRRSVRDIILQSARMGTKPIESEDELVADVLSKALLRPDHALRFPGQLSGGERQRVAIARALAARPKVLVCDEISSALDVSVQAMLVDLLDQLRRDTELTMLFVTHDISLARSIAQKIAVLKLGEIVEFGPVDSVLVNPQHEYTRELLDATPQFRLLDARAS